MSINSWKTSFVGLNKPPKVMSGTADSFTPLDLWPYANSVDDPYWAGGVNPQYYRWEVSFTINSRFHGSNLTRTPFSFDAQDIEVGDFVAGAQDGKVCQIMSISQKDNNTLTAIVEDRLRYNTFRDPTGFGLFGTPGPVIFFQINELGFPMLDPVPGEAAADFFTNVMSRFQYMNPLTNYIIEKINHGFEQGDAVCIEDGEFVLSDADNVTKFVGTVIYPGPGPNLFILRPGNGVIDFVPGLPGAVGDYVYPSTDGSGDLTTDTSSRRPIFMKIADSIPTYTTGTAIDPVGVDGDIVEINRIQVSLSSGQGSYSIDDAVNLINAQTADHKITAVKVGAAVEAVSDFDTQGNAYGVIAGYTPFSAEINGVLVNFSTTTSGSVTYGDATIADATDMVADINGARIPNIIASVNEEGKIKLRNNNGEAITITNVSADSQGNNFAGANSISSLAESTPANTSSYTLKLYRDDGGPMTIRDIQGTFFSDTGLVSGQNGRYALGLYIEQGLRSSNTSVVANIDARDALYPLVGDQAYVIDAGDGEWAQYMFNGSAWTRVANQRSDAVDAKTLTATLDFTQISNLQETVTLGTVTADRRILEIKIIVNTACDSDATIQIGNSNSVNQYVDIYDTDLSNQAEYSVSVSDVTDQRTEILITTEVTAVPAVGNVTVLLTYV
jgi:hypothetical protein